MKDCTNPRTVLRTHEPFPGTISSRPNRWEWNTGPCGTPLFSDEECRTGICRSCAGGWEHPNNYSTAAAAQYEAPFAAARWEVDMPAALREEVALALEESNAQGPAALALAVQVAQLIIEHGNLPVVPYRDVIAWLQTYTVGGLLRPEGPARLAQPIANGRKLLTAEEKTYTKLRDVNGIGEWGLLDNGGRLVNETFRESPCVGIAKLVKEKQAVVVYFTDTYLRQRFAAGTVEEVLPEAPEAPAAA